MLGWLVMPDSVESLGGSPAGYSVHGIFHARILEWVAISSSRDLPDPGTEPVSTVSPELQVGSLPTETSGVTLSWMNSRMSSRS